MARWSLMSMVPTHGQVVSYKYGSNTWPGALLSVWFSHMTRWSLMIMVPTHGQVVSYKYGSNTWPCGLLSVWFPHITMWSLMIMAPIRWVGFLWVWLPIKAIWCHMSLVHTHGKLISYEYGSHTWPVDLLSA